MKKQMCNKCKKVVKYPESYEGQHRTCPHCAALILFKKSENSNIQKVFCTNCGEQISNKIAICPKCGVPTNDKSTNDAVTKFLLPVGRSPYAIIAGYLGLFSMLIVFAPLALIFGILAIKDIQLNKTGGLGRAIFGTIMGSIFTIVLIIILINL